RRDLACVWRGPVVAPHSSISRALVVFLPAALDGCVQAALHLPRTDRGRCLPEQRRERGDRGGRMGVVRLAGSTLGPAVSRFLQQRNWPARCAGALCTVDARIRPVAFLLSRSDRAAGAGMVAL